MKHPGARWLATTLLPLFAGCPVGPDYRPPTLPVPGHWKSERGAGSRLTHDSAGALHAWWETFRDPVLTRLVTRAESASLDLKSTFTRVEQARAEYHAERSALYPSLSADAAGARVDNLLPIAVGDRSPPFNYFLAGFDAVWEIDLFGRLTRRREAAAAQLEAEAEDYRQAWVILSAELARNYTEFRNLQFQLRIARDVNDSTRQTADLTDQLEREGLGARQDTARARALAADTAARIPALEAQMADAQRRIEILVGADPGALQRELGPFQPVPRVPAKVLLATPAQSLRARPDIRAAERRLAAATATQAAAFAELFPRISIAAFAGLRNAELQNLFRSAAFAWAGGGAITQPIFNFGRIQAGIDLADARQQEAYFGYRQNVLVALHETETALTQLLKEEDRRRQLAELAERRGEASSQIEARFAAGLATRLDVLDARRSLYAARSELAQSESQVTVRLIALYKSLGGGIRSIPPAITPEDSPLG